MKKFAFFAFFVFLLIINKSYQSTNYQIHQNRQSMITHSIEPSTNNGPFSFLSMGEKASLNESNQILSKLNSNLNSLLGSQVMRKKRTTQDGRGCAQAFVQDGKTYYDCTSARSPDGQMKNKEWCYVDSAQPGVRNWDYCKPVMDYDKVRAANVLSLKEITKECRKINNNLSQNINPAQNALDDLKKVKEGQADLDNKINLMLKEISTINNNLVNLYSTKSQWENMDKLVKELDFKIEQKKEKQRKENQSSNESQDSSSLFTPKKETKNCDGMLLYEDEERGNGLIGKYFDNESWLGSYIERRDNDINFEWTGASPMKGINPNNFSIRWQGYIYAPYTGTYFFSVECDDGASLQINQLVIVSHNMNIAALIDGDQSDTGNGKSLNPNKSTSKGIKLTGGTKFKLILSYYHSVHDDLVEDGQSFLRLSWHSDEFEETIIPKKYLYRSNDFPPLKVTGFSNEDALLRKLNENDPAFKNSDRYILQDIPEEFIGSAVLKYNTRIMKDVLTFYINTPAVIYVAYLAHYPNPLPLEFENTGQTMSLLQIDKNANKNAKKLIAKKSGLLIIYKKKFSMGSVKIPLNKIGLNAKGVPMILFFGFDSSSASMVSCSGDEKNVSLSSSNIFKDCVASSEKENYKCEAAFNGKLRDQEGGMWASNNEGIGAWIIVNFKGLYQLNRFQYKDRKNPAERNSKIELTFSGGETVIYNLKNTDEIHDLKIESIKTTMVKITIRGVYGTINNGGGFNFFGVQCSEGGDDDIIKINDTEVKVKKIKPLFGKTSDRAVIVNCRESISNSHKFDEVKKNPGSKVTIKCPESCGNSDVPVYGSGIYAKDTTLCKSAFHAKKLPALGGKVIIVFAPGHTNYKAAFSNSIRSEGKAKSSLSLIFEEWKEEEEIILKPGTKVDVANPNGTGWIPMIILSVQEKNQKLKYLKLTKEGENSTPVSMAYPNKNKIHPCGEHLKERDCNGSRKKIKNKKPIKIRFVPKSYQNPGKYLPDSGQVYGEDGKQYGWSKDMSSRIRLRSNPSKPELETLVEFPPSPLSKFCNKPNPETLCEGVSWTAKVGYGRFFVRIFVGDPNSVSRIDLKVNDKFMARNKIIEKNTLEIIEDVIEANKQFITITSECSGDCKLAVSKINAIEIFPYDAYLPKDQEITKEIALNCGNAFKGGRCDTGPNVVHCLLDDAGSSSAKFCNGAQSLIGIPSNYKCKDQVGKFKCVFKTYSSESECRKYCPQDCQGSKCLYN